VHGTDRLFVDRRVQITDPGGKKANECHDWLDLWIRINHIGRIVRRVLTHYALETT